MWKHDWSWSAVTFGLRSPLCIKATDSDEDPLSGAGNSSDEDDDLLDEVGEKPGDEDGQDDDHDEGEESSREEKSRESSSRKFRFKDQEASEEAYAELQGHATRLEQQLASADRRDHRDASRVELNGQDEPSEVQIARQIAESVDREMSQLPTEKRTLRQTTEAIVRQVLKTVNESTVRVAESQARTVNAQEVARQQAEKSAQSALGEIGLNKPVHMRLLHEALGQRQTNPTAYRTWIETRTPDEQFKDLARDVSALVKELGGATREEIRQANVKHREQAGALEGGSRQVRTHRSDAEGSDDQEGKGGSMLDALQADQASLRKRARHFSSMVLGRRS